jgi:hypothetical protein
MIQIIEIPTRKLGVPKTWSEASDLLGTSEQTLTKCRKALDRFDEPINLELMEEVRRMVRFCEMRNAGGGGKCTRQEYLRIQNEEGQAALEDRLKRLGILSNSATEGGFCDAI